MSERPLTAKERAARKRRLAEVFGEVLPQQTNDDREPAEAAAERGRASDAWLRSQVPPHHG